MRCQVVSQHLKEAWLHVTVDLRARDASEVVASAK